MSKLDSRLLFFVLALGLLAVIWSCGQSDDLTRPKSVTVMWLTAERLPNPPPGMVYELWVAANPVTDTVIPSNELVSVGRFSYLSNDTIVAYLEPDGQVRADSNEFVLDDDMFKYSTIFITVERTTDPPGLKPGPIMLVEPITGRSNRLTLDFPLETNLWYAIVRFSMEGVTDGDRFANNGYGLWFSSYEYMRRPIPDTFGADISYTVDTIDPVVDTVVDIVTGETLYDTLNLAELYAFRPDTLWFEIDTFRIDFGRDTLVLDIDSFVHISMALKADSIQDTEPPFTMKNWSAPPDNYITPRSVDLDIFIQDDFGLPDYSDWGWKYQGWIVSDSIPTNALGTFTPPAWSFFNSRNNSIPGYQGGLLTTGTFSRIDEPDDHDPFTLKIIDRILTDTAGNVDTTYKRPMIPGEDFLNGDSLSAATNGVISGPFNLLPAPSGSTYGSVFITLEPANRLTSNTNFPLIAFLTTLPDGWSADILNPVTNRTQARQTMFGKFGTVGNDPSEGFPEIIIRISRM